MRDVSISYDRTEKKKKKPDAGENEVETGPRTASKFRATSEPGSSAGEGRRKGGNE